MLIPGSVQSEYGFSILKILLTNIESFCCRKSATSKDFAQFAYTNVPLISLVHVIQLLYVVCTTELSGHLPSLLWHIWFPSYRISLRLSFSLRSGVWQARIRQQVLWTQNRLPIFIFILLFCAQSVLWIWKCVTDTTACCWVTFISKFCVQLSSNCETVETSHHFDAGYWWTLRPLPIIPK